MLRQAQHEQMLRVRLHNAPLSLSLSKATLDGGLS